MSLASAIKRLYEKRHVKGASLNTERYVKELSQGMWTVTKAAGIMFEQEQSGFMSMYVAAGSGVTGGGGHEHHHKGIMEHWLIQRLKAASGSKSFFRQRPQNFTTALGQFQGSHEEIVHRTAHEIELGKKIETVMTTLHSINGDELWEASTGIWEVLIDKTDAETYDKTEMIPLRRTAKACGVAHRWFTDVSCLGPSG